jgi:ribose 1,5-bisphosphokinase
MTGTLIIIVGNSGSGKDSLLKEALAGWPENKAKVKITRRYITRPPHETEPFHSVTPEEFATMKTNNKFCLTWHVYGLDYGVPNEISEWLEQGELVIVNVSRAVIPDARKIFPELKVIFVKVPFEVTLARIKSRARESEDDPVFKQRVDRARNNQDLPGAEFVVDNTGALEIGAAKLRDYLLSFTK